jgi:hypothetical protein
MSMMGDLTNFLRFQVKQLKERSSPKRSTLKTCSKSLG